MDPARMFKESLTSRPELENSQGQKLPFSSAQAMSGLAAEAVVWPVPALCCSGPRSRHRLAYPIGNCRGQARSTARRLRSASEQWPRAPS